MLNQTLLIMKASTWYKPCFLYVIDLNGMTKFGITVNWQVRKKRYQRDFPNLPLQEIKLFQFERRWQAELIEYMMSQRLKRWVAKGRFEWVIELPVRCVLDCYNQTRPVIEPHFEYASTFHFTGERRYGYYKQLYDMLKGKFEGLM